MVKVSIIIPCYNKGEYLKECLLSVSNQVYSDWECIIVNDGSSDETATIAKEWCAKDERFTYFYQRNKGVSAARNTGIGLAKGKYILPLDCDDIIHEDYLKLAIESHVKNPELRLVYSLSEKIGNKSGLWALPEFSVKRLAVSNIVFNAAVFKKEHWVQVGGYDETMRLGLEDWDFWITLIQEDKQVYCIPKVCFYYRIVENSRNHSIKSQEYNSIYIYLNKKHLDFFIKHLGTHTHLLKELNVVKQEYNAILNSKKNALRVLLNFFNPFKKK